MDVIDDRAFRSKTSLRLKYEAESKVIRQQLGGLESIRKELGISQRKMCQLLMVDPSAWTRWIKDEERTPPHVYRSLQWYLALIDKYPVWNPHNTQLGSFKNLPYKEKYIEVQDQLNESLKKLQAKESEIQDFVKDQITDVYKQNDHLLKKFYNREQAQAGLKILLIGNSILIGILMFYVFSN